MPKYKDVDVYYYAGRYTKYEFHFDGPDMGRGVAEYILKNSGIHSHGMVNIYSSNHAMIETDQNQVEEWNSKIQEFFDKVASTDLTLKEYANK